MTKEQLAAENAALRELLAAARACADVPHPASYDNRNYMYEYELERRADAIAVWANGDREDMDPGVHVLVIQDRAKHLREEAAKPVRYEVKPAQDETPSAVLPHCAARWPNRGPAGGQWICTLDKGHDGDHEAGTPGDGRPFFSSVPQDDDEVTWDPSAVTA